MIPIFKQWVLYAFNHKNYMVKGFVEGGNELVQILALNKLTAHIGQLALNS